MYSSSEWIEAKYGAASESPGTGKLAQPARAFAKGATVSTARKQNTELPDAGVRHPAAQLVRFCGPPLTVGAREGEPLGERVAAARLALPLREGVDETLAEAAREAEAKPEVARGEAEPERDALGDAVGVEGAAHAMDTKPLPPAPPAAAPPTPVDELYPAKPELAARVAKAAVPQMDWPARHAPLLPPPPPALPLPPETPLYELALPPPKKPPPPAPHPMQPLAAEPPAYWVPAIPAGDWPATKPPAPPAAVVPPPP